MQKFKEIAYKTQIEPESVGGLTWYQRSFAVSEAGACNASLPINCRLDTTGNANEYIPEAGNIVYNNLAGPLVPFDGNNLFYVVVGYIAAPGDPIYHCQIQDATGVILSVTEITDCPPEGL